MRSQATSPPLTVTVLAALWVTVGRCDVTEAPGCDSGKLYLDRDMPQDAVNWDCPVSAWPESSQRLPSVDTVFDPEPARQICMDQSISYNHSIPSSGAYRPVRAESGEYLYCPPQRWLNNLHHGATVLLFHPCAPLHERLLLSVLARSCVPHYIFTPHPELSKHTPLALVSWGRTLELSSVASSDVCDWLETTTSTGQKFVGVSQSSKYNLLLTWSAEQQQTHPEQQTKESLRRCCEQTISSLLSGAMESSSKEQSLKAFQERGRSRQIRAAVRGKQDTEDHENTTTRESNRTTLSGTGDVLRHNSTLGSASPPGNRTLSVPPGPREAPSQPDIHNTNQGLAARPKARLGSNVTEAALRAESVGLGTAGSLKNRLTVQTAARQPSPQHTALRKTQPSAGLEVVSSDTLTPHSKDEGTDSAAHVIKKEHSDGDSAADGMMKDNEVVDVQERELVLELTHSDTHSGHRSEKTVPVSKSQPESPSHPQLHPNPQLVSYLPGSHDCASCKAGERCDCDKDSGAAAPAAAVNKGLPRTPRTDEAVWAAAALGFLLVLLTLSVLHTRLYRHWRTTPSLYWHDPQQDYDSVADVIRRRLRIAKRRRKRGRRQECVLLPSSSSSDELS